MKQALEMTNTDLIQYLKTQAITAYKQTNMVVSLPTRNLIPK